MYSNPPVSKRIKKLGAPPRYQSGFSGGWVVIDSVERRIVSKHATAEDAKAEAGRLQSAV